MQVVFLWGCTIFELYSHGRRPFPDLSTSEAAAVLDIPGAPPWPCGESILKHERVISMLQCIFTNETERITLEGLIHLLERLQKSSSNVGIIEWQKLHVVIWIMHISNLKRGCISFITSFALFWLIQIQLFLFIMANSNDQEIIAAGWTAIIFGGCIGLVFVWLLLEFLLDWVQSNSISFQSLKEKNKN